MIFVHKFLYIPVLPTSVKKIQVGVCGYFGGSITVVENKNVKIVIQYIVGLKEIETCIMSRDKSENLLVHPPVMEFYLFSIWKATN